MTREPIYAALFQRVLSSTSWAQGGATSGRLVKDIDVVPAAECPCFFQVIRGETPKWVGQGGACAWTIEAWLFVYVAATDPKATLPQTALGGILDAVETALAPEEAYGRQTLGFPDLISHAHISGKVELYEALLADHTKAVAIVPIAVMTAGI